MESILRAIENATDAGETSVEFTYVSRPVLDAFKSHPEKFAIDHYTKGEDGGYGDRAVTVTKISWIAKN